MNDATASHIAVNIPHLSHDDMMFARSIETCCGFVNREHTQVHPMCSSEQFLSALRVRRTVGTNCEPNVARTQEVVVVASCIFAPSPRLLLTVHLRPAARLFRHPDRITF